MKRTNFVSLSCSCLHCELKLLCRSIITVNYTTTHSTLLCIPSAGRLSFDSLENHALFTLASLHILSSIDAHFMSNIDLPDLIFAFCTRLSVLEVHTRGTSRIKNLLVSINSKSQIYNSLESECNIFHEDKTFAPQTLWLVSVKLTHHPHFIGAKTILRFGLTSQSVLR
jgi:hypothetical protein